jgi:hypothetical protein
MGRRFEAADSGGLLALALSRLGDYDGAKRVLLEVLDEFKAVGNLASTLAILDLASVIEVEHGDVERALRIIGAADAIREREGGMLSSLDILRLERPRETAARMLPADEIERLYAEGRGMSLEQAIAEARKEAPALAG